MSHELVAEDYVACARDAEARAENFTDPALREAWLGVAATYRQMASNRLARANPSTSPRAYAVGTGYRVVKRTPKTGEATAATDDAPE